jgi:bisphosphoglycerate-dependent phosphoglycerate mutase
MSDKVMIQVSRETLDFMRDLARKIETQDNRCTAKPYFFVIQKKQWRVTRNGYGHGETRTCRLDFEGDPTAYYSKEEWLQHCREYEIDPDRAERKWDDMEEFEEEAYEEEDNCFLTQAAYEEHLRLNGHNLCRGEHWSYLKHAV